MYPRKVAFPTSYEMVVTPKGIKKRGHPPPREKVMGVLALRYPGPQVRGCLLRVWLSERTAKREIPLHMDVQAS